jgi:hypothetical protein
MLDQMRYSLEQNLARVENLVQTYETHPDAKGKGRKSAAVLDILRAAVVLLHASLEDVLRSTARWKLPMAAGAALNDIPLVGHGPSPRKFLLGDLAAFRGKLVDDVLTDSVQAYLEHSNYNNVGEIASLLNAIGLDLSTLSPAFPELQELMERRHQIVHRADRQATVAGRGDHEIRGINRHTVRAWAQAVRNFSGLLFAQLAG